MNFCTTKKATALGSLLLGMAACSSDVGEESFTQRSFPILTAATWTNTTNVDAVDSSITKTGSVGWNAGASSNESLTGDGAVEFTTSENTAAKMAGLSSDDANQHYADIDFAIFLSSTGALLVYEGGVFRGVFGKYVPGDVLRVETVGGVVRYLRNGSLFYTSSGTPSSPLYFDTSLNHTGATIQNVAFREGEWRNAVGVNDTANSLTKTGSLGWNAGAATIDSFTGDGYAEFTTQEQDTAKMGGLSNGDNDQSYSDIDFAIFLSSAGYVQVYENGSLRGTFGTYLAGNVFRIEAVNDVVTYLKDGVAFYTSAGTPIYPLLFDTSLNHTGATITSVTVADLALWQNEYGLDISGSSLTKTAGLGWNSGASSTSTVAADGHVEFTTTENTAGKMAGLSNGDSNYSYSEIDFAVFLSSAGYVQVYEAGTYRGTFGSYAPGDVFRIDVTSGVVTYLKNDVLFYTSAQTPTLPLLFDTSFNQTGGNISGVAISG